MSQEKNSQRATEKQSPPAPDWDWLNSCVRATFPGARVTVLEPGMWRVRGTGLIFAEGGFKPVRRMFSRRELGPIEQLLTVIREHIEQLNWEVPR